MAENVDSVWPLLCLQVESGTGMCLSLVLGFLRQVLPSGQSCHLLVLGLVVGTFTGRLPLGLPARCLRLSALWTPLCLPCSAWLLIPRSPSEWGSVPLSASPAHREAQGLGYWSSFVAQSLPVQPFLLSQQHDLRTSPSLANCDYVCTFSERCLTDDRGTPSAHRQHTIDPSLPWLGVVWPAPSVFWGSAGVSLSPSFCSLQSYVLHYPILFPWVAESILGRFKTTLRLWLQCHSLIDFF